MIPNGGVVGRRPSALDYPFICFLKIVLELYYRLRPASTIVGQILNPSLDPLPILLVLISQVCNQPSILRHVLHQLDLQLACIGLQIARAYLLFNLIELVAELVDIDLAELHFNFLLRGRNSLKLLLHVL